MVFKKGDTVECLYDYDEPYNITYKGHEFKVIKHTSSSHRGDDDFDGCLVLKNDNPQRIKDFSVCAKNFKIVKPLTLREMVQNV